MAGGVGAAYERFHSTRSGPSGPRVARLESERGYVAESGHPGGEPSAVGKQDHRPRPTRRLRQKMAGRFFVGAR